MLRALILWHTLDASLLDMQLARDPLGFRIPTVSNLKTLARDGAMQARCSSTVIAGSFL